MSLPLNFPNDVDARLTDRVRLLLATQSVYAFRRLAVETSASRVTLSGVVTSYYHRQLAVALVRRIAGVTGVTDRHEVAAPPFPSFTEDASLPFASVG